jgi:hypothetical protein
MIKDSLYLRWALERANARNTSKEAMEEYLRYTRNACGLLATSGAAQTLLFLAGKGGKHKEVADDLLSAPGLQQDLLERLHEVSTRDYIRYSRALRKALVFLKRAAEIMMHTYEA